MTNEEKQLLLKDLCARLPYGVIVSKKPINESFTWKELQDFQYGKIYKPYLRPMSSMTDGEKRELQSFFPSGFGNQWLDIEKETIEIFECPSTITLYLNDSKKVIDFFNVHHIDYHGLIPIGLAIEAPKDMYKTE